MNIKKVYIECFISIRIINLKDFFFFFTFCYLERPGLYSYYNNVVLSYIKKAFTNTDANNASKGSKQNHMDKSKGDIL